jgi:hypothetical protein
MARFPLVKAAETGSSVKNDYREAARNSIQRNLNLKNPKTAQDFRSRSGGNRRQS